MPPFPQSADTATHWQPIHPFPFTKHPRPGPSATPPVIHGRSEPKFLYERRRSSNPAHSPAPPAHPLRDTRSPDWANPLNTSSQQIPYPLPQRPRPVETAGSAPPPLLNVSTTPPRPPTRSEARRPAHLQTGNGRTALLPTKRSLPFMGNTPQKQTTPLPTLRKDTCDPLATPVPPPCYDSTNPPQKAVTQKNSTSHPRNTVHNQH